MKEYWNNKDKRKGLLTTILVHALLLVLFLFVGLSYLDPKPEDGIVINFGNSATGMGQQADGAQSTRTPPQPAEETSPPTETTSPSEATETPLATQNTVDAPAVQAKPKTSKNPQEEKKPVETSPTKPTEQQPETKPEPEPSDALKQLLQTTQDSKAGGEGVTQGAGDQGDPDGDKNSPNRSGNGGGGNGGGGNYLLGGRQALQKPKPNYPCSDQGRVVVKIYVNQNGAVTRAIPGERVPGGSATTTTSSCLYSEAKTAALKTTWQSKADAPDLQIGYIIYNFRKQ
jgi:outer membrane biosynthesis protein TonB